MPIGFERAIMHQHQHAHSEMDVVKRDFPARSDVVKGFEKRDTTSRALANGPGRAEPPYGWRTRRV
jgi:hypothetical protein